MNLTLVLGVIAILGLGCSNVPFDAEMVSHRQDDYPGPLQIPDDILDSFVEGMHMAHESDVRRGVDRYNITSSLQIMSQSILDYHVPSVCQDGEPRPKLCLVGLMMKISPIDPKDKSAGLTDRSEADFKWCEEGESPCEDITEKFQENALRSINSSSKRQPIKENYNTKWGQIVFNECGALPVWRTNQVEGLDSSLNGEAVSE